MYMGTIGGANNFCLQKSSMQIGRIGIFYLENHFKFSATTRTFDFVAFPEVKSTQLTKDYFISKKSLNITGNLSYLSSRMTDCVKYGTLL